MDKKEALKQIKENNPEYIYGPDDDPSQNMLDEIQFQTIVFVVKNLLI